MTEETTVVLSTKEIIEVTEDAAVLELLFQYVHPWPTPDLRGISIELLAALAEAVEKYLVYASQDTLRSRMRRVEFWKSLCFYFLMAENWYILSEKSSLSTIYQCLLLQLSTESPNCSTQVLYRLWSPTITVSKKF